MHRIDVNLTVERILSADPAVRQNAVDTAKVHDLQDLAFAVCCVNELPTSTPLSLADLDDVARLLRDGTAVPRNGWETIEEFRMAHPGAEHCLCITAIDDNGEVHIAYFEGNSDRAFVGSYITSCAYVNGFTVSIRRIAVPV